MCFRKLRIKDTLKVAKNDIVCYKILRSVDTDLRSPFQRKFKWDNRRVKTSYLDITNSKKTISDGFHSFIEIKNASYYRRQFYSLKVPECQVYKFIIPKGSKYYQNKSQYVSNKIKLALKTPVHFFKSK